MSDPRNMLGGGAANLQLVPYSENAVRQLASLAHDLGVLIHIEGIPFGDLSKSGRVQGRGVFGGQPEPGFLGQTAGNLGQPKGFAT